MVVELQWQSGDDDGDDVHGGNGGCYDGGGDNGGYDVDQTGSDVADNGDKKDKHNCNTDFVGLNHMH